MDYGDAQVENTEHEHVHRFPPISGTGLKRALAALLPARPQLSPSWLKSVYKGRELTPALGATTLSLASCRARFASQSCEGVNMFTCRHVRF
jgi:hypothetical protein